MAAGSTIADYVNGLGIDNKLRETIGGTTDYFLTDRLGTTRAFADSNGSVSTSLTYDSLGNPITGSFSSRFTYIGREQDGDTGLMYYRLRWYDSPTGRFMLQDPAGFAGGTSAPWYDPQVGRFVSKIRSVFADATSIPIATSIMIHSD